MSKFQNDLKFGQMYEQELIKILNPESYELSKGKFKPYDIIITNNNKIRKYEVKSDRLSFKTNNLCIEFECNNKESGINTTESHYYAYFVITDNNEYNLYIIPTKRIKREIEKKSYHKIMNGGDGYRSKFYLFKIDLFQKYKFLQ
jgi:hypothetical protein